MKRNLFNIASLALIGLGVILINACQKDDSTAPVLTLNGASTIYISLNKKYADPGVSADDNKDGTVAVTSDYGATNPNVNLAGTYIIHYSAADNTGNVGRVTRTVVVSNDAQSNAGIYEVTDNISGNNNYTSTNTVEVVASTTLNNQLFLSNLSGLGEDVTVSAKVSGTALALTPVNQSPVNMPVGTTVSGSGSTGSGKITSLNYTINYASGGSDNGTSVLWKKIL